MVILKLEQGLQSRVIIVVAERDGAVAKVCCAKFHSGKTLYLNGSNQRTRHMK